ncbi:hypothetical protein GCM10027093_08610 [Paraburkholderia jirisanensis]
MDAVSYHAYGMSLQDIRATAGYVRDEYGVPAVITEWGVSSSVPLIGKFHQAQAVESFLADATSMQTTLISLYEWQDSDGASKVRERGFGLVDGNGDEKPVLGRVRAALHAE